MMAFALGDAALLTGLERNADVVVDELLRAHFS